MSKPKMVKRSYRVPPGWITLDPDFSQAEIRMLNILAPKEVSNAVRSAVFKLHPLPCVRGGGFLPPPEAGAWRARRTGVLSRMRPYVDGS
jgi:hypothetical protein